MGFDSAQICISFFWPLGQTRKWDQKISFWKIRATLMHMVFKSNSDFIFSKRDVDHLIHEKCLVDLENNFPYIYTFALPRMGAGDFPVF